MKKTVLTLVASQLLFAGSTFANQDNATFTVKAPKFVATCGVNATKNVAEVGNYFDYTVNSNTNFEPFVNITSWETGADKITPEYVTLDGIGYKFGDVGMPMGGWRLGEPETHGKFRVLKKDGVQFPPDLKDTELTLTVTCFDTHKDFKTALKWTNYETLSDALFEHNNRTNYVNGNIVTPTDPAEDTHLPKDAAVELPTQANDKAVELPTQDQNGQTPPPRETAES